MHPNETDPIFRHIRTSRAPYTLPRTGRTGVPHAASSSALVVLGFALQLAACGETGPTGGSAALRHEVDSAGGILRVRSLGAPDRWALRPISTVGSEGGVGGPAPDEFGRIVSVAPGPEGRLWVADAPNHEIKVFARDGSLVLRTGREGQGPGEFLSLYSLAWIGERLLVLDFGNGRIAELSSTGEWLGTRPAPGRISGAPALLRFYPVNDSTVYQWSLRPTDGSRVWVEHDAEGIRREWEQHSLDPPLPQALVCRRPDGAISFFDMPFGGRVLQHPAGSGNTYVAWSADYRLALLAPTGDTLRVVERVRPRVPMHDDEWNEAAAEFADFREEWPDADCEPPGLVRPDFKAAIRNMLVDRVGRLWVEVHTETGTEWEIFDATGRLRGALPGFAYDERLAPSLGDTLLAWVDRDTMGVQRAHLARLWIGPPPDP